MAKFACVVFKLDDGNRLIASMEKLRCAFPDEEAEVFLVENTDQAAQQIKVYCTNRETDYWKECLKKLLSKLGATSKLMGYEMLFTVFEKFIELSPKQKSPGRMGIAYNYAAAKHGVSSAAVERDIRTVISTICAHNTNEEMGRIMGIPISDNMKITNSNFIALLSQAVFR